MQGIDSGARVAAMAQRARERGVDGVLITPGPDLRYAIGYDAIPLERLTCLVVRASEDCALVVPRLELLAAQASPAGQAGIEILTWGEGDDPYALVASLLPAMATVALDNHMWAEKVLRLREAMPGATQTLAGPVISSLRMRKDESERAALLAAGAAIDSVHALVPQFLRAGRSERDVGADISDAILQAGHAVVDFVIVASGPNSASPHHEVSDRIITEGDAVVVDIGGTMPSGYCSDSTRTYAIGDPGTEFLAAYAVLQEAQAAAVRFARAGVSCEDIDAAARNVLVEAGLGDLFIHRTGHGIGLETHEDPYIVAGNDLVVESGMAFSIEPGFYLEGRFGARIEDIVIATDDGVLVANTRPRHLVVIP